PLPSAFQLPFWPSPLPCASFLLLSVCSSVPVSAHCTNKKPFPLRHSCYELNLALRKKGLAHLLLAYGFAGAGRWCLGRGFHWWRESEREGLDESVRRTRVFEKLCLSAL
ncbi:hypothetical protein V8G54_014139, partial [Vigna mungo]